MENDGKPTLEVGKVYEVKDVGKNSIQIIDEENEPHDFDVIDYSGNYEGLNYFFKKVESDNKTIEYFRKNAEEDYKTTPISVLRYITELEKLQTT